MLNKRIKNILQLFSALILLMLASLTIAAPPQVFSAYYDARIQGLKAQAEISLTQIGDAEFLANSSVRIRLFGATVSRIRESSQFEWIDDSPRPQHYEYIQSGIGGRSRSIDFDWQNNLALATVKNDSFELQLEQNTLDELSMYTLIKHELSNGNEDISFAVIDSNVVEEYRYRVIAEEEVATEAGVFSAIKVERVRSYNGRITQLWFAKNFDMLLVKLFHRDPDGDEYEITLSNAQVNGEAVVPQVN